ncbi:RNA polymerase primary sigma factor/RNA polymerase nonessential primary-like sigma factor [Saccharothrix tamanrassetensis]|uniref:RNA polymerase sigma factor n=1 Tax=Saccharothrix tamanrassetensis TaxID=1051531 RepID=A0A841CWK9_9PSEU|nr:sigma-70 family RNA polymerase sigma factor [Saccharothrix tamanrassetensis]MBB5960694.1 RNA polymerase primary sigma factor/RNA polymerase nonessential primary-like sigma factor [Saccharothrix tamanrassetensis]
MSSTMETPRPTRPAASGREWSADADLVGHYLREVGSTPLLTAEQEVDLSRRIEAGVYATELLRRVEEGESPPIDAERHRALRAVAHDGDRAKEHMIRANLRLVVSVAKKHSYRGLPFLDVVQEGNLGLIRAVEKFDYAKGFKFSTYATWWIRQAIGRALADQTRTVRLPVHVVEELNRATKAERRLRLELDREPKAEEVAEAARIPVARLLELRQAGRTVISLETPIGADGDSSVADLIEDAEAVRAHEAVEQAELTAELRILVNTLPERQAQILNRRYGLDDGRSRTLQEVAEELGLTRERIRQLEKESLRLLRDPERNRTVLELAG